MNNKITVAIVGATGYTGLELIKIIVNHPIFELTYVANSQGGLKVTDLHPMLDGVVDMDVNQADPIEIKKVAQLVFLALPHKTAMGFAKELLALDLKVVDLSADYRLQLDTYEKYYCPHEDKENLPLSVYGLPEIYKENIAQSSLVANPGCYPTASLLAVLPFVPYLNDNQSIFIDAKSGISGAGKKASETTAFVNISENMFAYNPLKHRHTPEIKEKIKLIQNKDIKVNFVPHLIPVTRGMLVSVYLSVNSEIDAKQILKEYYANKKFVRVQDKPVTIKNTSGTNFCDIYVEQNGNDLFISSSIDNLLRGASSQAVVNANIMYGLDEALGIPVIAYAP